VKLEDKLEKRKKVYRSGLRAINRGTRYDIHGKLLRIARDIEHGKLGDVRDVVVIIKRVSVDATMTSTHHIGTGTIADVSMMLKAAESDVTG
jgi:hypothetical protein